MDSNKHETNIIIKFAIMIIGIFSNSQKSIPCPIYHITIEGMFEMLFHHSEGTQKSVNSHKLKN